MSDNNTEAKFFYCENCGDTFSGNDVLIENDQPHCPYCGGMMIAWSPAPENRKGE